MHKILLGAGEAQEFGFIEHIPFETYEVHPEYNLVTFEHDVWMIKLKWPSQLYADQVVVLDTPTDGVTLTPGDNVQAMGFGALSSGGTSPNVLQTVTMQHISTADCTAPGNYDPSEITPDMFCLSVEGGVDTCQVFFLLLFLRLQQNLNHFHSHVTMLSPCGFKGDSGGPIVLDGTNTQIGIVSWGDGCATKPGVYARISDNDNFGFISDVMSRWAGKAGKPPRNRGCTDRGGFYSNIDDESTTKYNCLWYAEMKHCQLYGQFFSHAGLTANDACCACGGGTRVNAEARKRI
jgi:hypothetical protein